MTFERPCNYRDVQYVLGSTRRIVLLAMSAIAQPYTLSQRKYRINEDFGLTQHPAKLHTEVSIAYEQS